MISSNQQTISIKLKKIIFPREDYISPNSFCIFATDSVKCKGILPFTPRIGMELTLTGCYSEYHGELDFKFSKVTQNIPVDEFAILDYCGELSKGIGQATIKKIKDKYGREWQSHLDEMNQSWAIPLRQTLHILMSDKNRMETIAYCMSVGFTPRIGRLAFEKWHESANTVIKENPYLLTQIKGIGFRTVDELRERFEIKIDDKRRAIAAVEYIISDMMESSGNSIILKSYILEKSRDFGINEDVICEALQELSINKRINIFETDNVIDSKELKYEETIFEYIGNHKQIDKKYIINYDSEIEFDETQMLAIENAIRIEGYSIINGGAGCGKTSIIKQIVKNLYAYNEDVELCAFSGKAAARLREATGYKASTIHSMLKYGGEDGTFMRKSLSDITVIIDEASMIPSVLLYEIVKRKPKRIVLVGDQAQLPPVGVGCPFHDLVKHCSKITSTLNTCYRNKEAIFNSANLVRNGNIPCNKTTRNEHFEIIKLKDPEEIHKTILRRVVDNEIDFSQDVIVSPRNGEVNESGNATVNGLNNDIQNIVNKHNNGEQFKIGDRVMCIKNNSKLDIWNGTTGFISRIDIDGYAYFKSDDGDEKKIPKDFNKYIVPAYCLTIHKAQGSQYRNVYIVILKRDQRMMLDRSMLYTAITRAKSKCVILTDAFLASTIGMVRERKTYLNYLFTHN